MDTVEPSVTFARQRPASDSRNAAISSPLRTSRMSRTIAGWFQVLPSIALTHYQEREHPSSIYGSIKRCGCDFQPFRINNLEMVDQNSASWNQIALWLSRIKTLADVDTRVA